MISMYLRVFSLTSASFSALSHMRNTSFSCKSHTELLVKLFSCRGFLLLSCILFESLIVLSVFFLQMYILYFLFASFSAYFLVNFLNSSNFAHQDIKDKGC